MNEYHAFVGMFSIKFQRHSELSFGSVVLKHFDAAHAERQRDGELPRRITETDFPQRAGKHPSE
jgi:hypothetical protein